MLIDFCGGDVVLIKTFIIGIFLGIAAAAGAMYAIPAVDQHREVSYVAVAPNGGNSETFHINVPSDRVMAGGGDQASLPEGLMWPEDEILGRVSAEIFKIRNTRDTVVGVAARTVAREGDAAVLDWVIHLPARGSFYINMSPVADESGYRAGTIRTGSREMQSMTGRMTERWVADTSGDEEAPAGRIELSALYVSLQEPDE